MRQLSFRCAALVLGLSMLAACSHQPPAPSAQQSALERALDLIRRDEAPDARTAVWEIKLSCDDIVCRIEGATDRPKAFERIRAAAAAARPAAAVSVRLLPETSGSAHGSHVLAATATASLSGSPGFGKPVTTQALMGDLLEVLERRGSFLRVRLADGYIGWVHRLQTAPVSSAGAHSTGNAPRVVVTQGQAQILDAQGAVVSMATLMNRLELLGEQGGDYLVGLPDGRTGLLSKAVAQPEDAYLARWRRLRSGSRDAYVRELLKNARSLVGTPYVWGGTSVAGLDCSGFVSLVYRMTGAVVPRDADQLAAAAQPVLHNRVEDIEPGELLFFGKRSAGGVSIEHVALSLGAGDFIHALGSVRIESLSEASPRFSAYERGRFLGAGRLNF